MMGPVILSQSANQHDTILTNHWRHIDNQLDFTQNLFENRTLIVRVEIS